MKQLSLEEYAKMPMGSSGSSQQPEFKSRFDDSINSLQSKFKVQPLTPQQKPKQAEGDIAVRGVGDMLQSINPMNDMGFDIGKRLGSLGGGIAKTVGGAVMPGFAQTGGEEFLGKFGSGVGKAIGDGVGNLFGGIGNMAQGSAQALSLIPEVFGPNGGSAETTRKVQEASNKMFNTGGLRSIQGIGSALASPVIGAMGTTPQAFQESLGGGLQQFSKLIDDGFRSVGADVNSAEVNNIKQGLLAALDIGSIGGLIKGGAKVNKAITSSPLMGKADDFAKNFDNVLSNKAKGLANMDVPKFQPDIGKFTPARFKDAKSLANSALTGKIKPVLNKLVGTADDQTKNYVRFNTELVRNAPKQVQNTMVTMQDLAKKLAAGQKVRKPVEILGSKAGDAVEVILKAKKGVGKDIGDLIQANSKKIINATDEVDNFLTRLKGDRVSILDDGIDFSASKYANDVNAKNVIKAVTDTLNKKTVGGVTKLSPVDLQILREQIRPFKPEPGVVSSAESLINQADDMLKSLLDRNVIGYAPLAKQYSGTIGTLNDLSKLVGKQVDDLTAADLRFGEVSSRILGNASDRPTRVFSDLFNRANELGGKVDTFKDFEKLAKYNDFLQELYPSTVAPRGFEGGIKRGAQQGLNAVKGGKAGILDTALTATVNKVFGDNDAVVRKYFEELVKQTQKNVDAAAGATKAKETVKKATQGKKKMADFGLQAFQNSQGAQQ